MQRSNRLTAGFPLLSPFGCETLSPHCRARAEGEGEMIDNKKSGDPGLSAAERKELREREAQEAIADLEEAQRAFHENRERLREERLRREAAVGPMLYPAPELPDDTPHRKRPIFYEDPERCNRSGMENRRRNSRGFGCNAVGPKGSWT